MKKLICIMIALMIPVAAFAEVDLSGMSYDELVQLKDQVSLAIWESEEWQEVEVPAGVYTVGEDIPAGKWTIKAADGISVTIEWGDLLDDSGVALSWDGKFMEYEYLRSENNKYYEKGDKTQITWDIKDGQYILVDDGIAVFMPYAGKPSLGFK